MTEDFATRVGALAGVAVASMVPSMTAVGRQGVPLLPGLLYGDREGRPTEDATDDAIVPLGEKVSDLEAQRNADPPAVLPDRGDLRA